MLQEVYASVEVLSSEKFVTSCGQVHPIKSKSYQRAEERKFAITGHPSSPSSVGRTAIQKSSIATSPAERARLSRTTKALPELTLPFVHMQNADKQLTE
jgi:hypothetical protein